MLPFHERLAGVGLAAIGGYGFVLAGGYAISANGIGDRPSDDVDLFTNSPDPDRFGEAAARLRDALRAEGLDVVDLRVRPTFVDLQVSDPVAGVSSELQLGLDFRNFPPAQLALGPVLDVRDAVGSKMSALWSRGEARDYIDIDAVLASGRFTRGQVLAIADQVETQPLDRSVLATRFREAGRHPQQRVTDPGVCSVKGTHTQHCPPPIESSQTSCDGDLECRHDSGAEAFRPNSRQCRATLGAHLRPAEGADGAGARTASTCVHHMSCWPRCGPRATGSGLRSVGRSR